MIIHAHKVHLQSNSFNFNFFNSLINPTNIPYFLWKIIPKPTTNVRKGAMPKMRSTGKKTAIKLPYINQ